MRALCPEGRTLGSWVEALRDRIVVLSQIGKRKLDAASTRRELDRKLVVLGERILSLSREGRIALPNEVVGALSDARELEERLEAEEAEIAALQGGAA